MGKGRDIELIKLRNAALVRRYYYWTEVQRKRFDDVLHILSRQEFFISEERILKIIRSSDIKKYVDTPSCNHPRLAHKQLSLFKSTP